MTDRRPIDETDIEALVAGHLRHEAGELHAEDALARLRDAMADEASPRKFERPFVMRRMIRWSAAVGAIAAVVALALMSFMTPAYASPAQLLRDVEVNLSQPLDRCYLVETTTGRDPQSMGDDTAAVLTQSFTTKLWVRGDLYWIESTNPERHWAWGRDESGGLWITVTAHKGIRFDADEVPQPLSMGVDVLGIRMRTMLIHFLKDFDLRRDQFISRGQASGPVITATLKPDAPAHGPLQSATLEIDANTKELRRLTVERVFNGWHNTVKLTLLETKQLSEDEYRIDGHLEEPYEVLGREEAPKRAAILVHMFGPRAAAWLSGRTPPFQQPFTQPFPGPRGKPQI